MSARLIVVALDGADPRVLSGLVDRGAMPTLHEVVEAGASGTLSAASPLVRAMTWTSVATGVRAPAHGVCGDAEVRPDGAGVRPVTRAAWKRPAFWERLGAAGVPNAVVGWPGTAPAQAWTSGIVVDDAFARPIGDRFDAWPLLPDCIAPATLRATLRELRVHPADIDAGQIATLVPRGTDVDQDRDDRLARLAFALAQSATIHAAATAIAARDDWRCLAVFYPWLADVQRSFMALRAPRAPFVDEREHAIYADVVDHAHRFQDAMLATLRRHAPDATLMVVSAYGFAHGSDRAPPSAAMPDWLRWHRAPGFVAAAGEGIAPDALLHGASIVDVAPTVLVRFDVAFGGCDGRPIDAIVGRAVAAQPSSTREAASPEPAPSVNVDAHASDVVRGAARAWAMHAAEALVAHGDHAAAADAYRTILDDAPGSAIAALRLASCLLAEGDAEQAAATADRLAQTHPELPWGWLIGGTARIVMRRHDEARTRLAEAEARAHGLPNVALRLGALQLVLGDWPKAESLFRAAIADAPWLAQAFDGLGCALHGQGRFADAEQSLRTALGLQFHYPLGHLHLALTLASQRRWDEAMRAVRTALEQEPGLAGAADLRRRIERARGPQLVVDPR